MDFAEGRLAHWAILLGLGAFHGLNPAMGWLFAVALGLQEGSGRAVWRALLPLTAGHALAVLAAILLVLAAGAAIPPEALRWTVALLLMALGAYRLIRQRHPGWGGMQVSLTELTFWSFLMASAHGAGLMVAPVFMGMADLSGPASGHAHIQASSAGLGLLAGLAHTGAYLLVTALIAWIVYAKIGLALLRKAWINIDLIWAIALIATGLLTLIW